MTDEPSFCVVCAWRKDCQKKYLGHGSELRCRDFTRDVTIKKENVNDTKADSGDTEGGPGTSQE